MKRQQIGLWVIIAYLWVMMILMGSLLMETFMIYPNVFRDAPASLELGMQFMSHAGPSDYFPPLGFLSWVTGAGALILGWRVKSARYWILGSLLMIIADGLVSMAFFWPRNTIMFIEGSAVHSVEFLRQTAYEFESLHWLRLALSIAGSALIFTGFMRYYRHLLRADESSQEG